MFNQITFWAFSHEVINTDFGNQYLAYRLVPLASQTVLKLKKENLWKSYLAILAYWLIEVVIYTGLD